MKSWATIEFVSSVLEFNFSIGIKNDISEEIIIRVNISLNMYYEYKIKRIFYKPLLQQLIIRTFVLTHSVFDALLANNKMSVLFTIAQDFSTILYGDISHAINDRMWQYYKCNQLCFLFYKLMIL